ncbi:DNA-binding IclR family transcriptional regulator [Inhella inkyongensis]|uniref:DNA-binding IclR family transcriptional regulator n=1 Tax=Inhella inkyongensis TaxID=392593 RepID=A0A840S556_9BURK|nr:helix-turn-helix domain-containing protein [Inhella inkyongensis]MBB5203640.1 DNA-binding IclR family transcriptional regulator [Inhella inkyongensis]
MSEKQAGGRGIQSIEVGGALLQALAAAGRPLALKDLALAAGMTAAKAHPYLVSFSRLGLVEQTSEGAPYALGPFARSLGLISLQQDAPLQRASAELAGLAQALDMTVGLATWTEQGPIVLRVAEPPGPVHLSLKLGAVLSLSQSASGQVLSAAIGWDGVAALWQRAEPTLTEAEVKARLAAVRRQGWARSDESLVPGVSALAVALGTLGATPLRLAFVALAPREWMDARLPGVVQALQQAAQRCAPAAS